jgi:hypothetical protein
MTVRSKVCSTQISYPRDAFPYGERVSGVVGFLVRFFHVFCTGTALFSLTLKNATDSFYMT